MKRHRLTRLSIAACAALLLVAWPVERAGAALLDSFNREDLAKLTAEQKQRLLAYLEAQALYNKQADQYWNFIAQKRALRKQKVALGHPVTPADYVTTQPPVYKGPPKPADVFKILEKPELKPPVKPLPVLADFLRNAEEQYGFKPTIVSDEEFKRRYAIEALRLGFSQDQIVKVYALETGGYGAFDMQAVFNPVTKKVKPISSALGYAQLLHANSVEVLRAHGAGFAERLERMARVAGQTQARAAELRQKAVILRAMLKDMRGLPDSWKAHLSYGASPKGLAVHALNLDADIGPWLQIEKLNGIREYAASKGWPHLTGAQLELMNLAGPGRGFEMLQPAARDAATANFFERQGYERNPVVHNKTASQLLAKLDEIMQRNRLKDGARLFDTVFERLTQR